MHVRPIISLQLPVVSCTFLCVLFILLPLCKMPCPYPPGEQYICFFHKLSPALLLWRFSWFLSIYTQTHTHTHTHTHICWHLFPLHYALSFHYSTGSIWFCADCLTNAVGFPNMPDTSIFYYLIDLSFPKIFLNLLFEDKLSFLSFVL